MLFNLLRTLLVLVLASLSFTTTGQILKQWEARYTEVGHTNEIASDVIVDEAGNTYVVGKTGNDAILVKYDRDGKLIWTFRGGKGIIVETDSPVLDAKRGPDGNFYMLIEGDYYSGMVLVKVDPNGQLVWKKQLPGYEEKSFLAIHTDGSVYAWLHDQFLEASLSKFSSDGQLQWSHVMSHSKYIEPDGLKLTDDNVVIWGHHDYGRTSPFLHVYDHAGTLRWKDEYVVDEGRSSLLNQVEVVDGVLYAGYWSANKRNTLIRRYDVTSGAILQTFNVLGDGSYSLRFMVAADGFLYTLDNSDGDKFIHRRWTLTGTLQWWVSHMTEANLGYLALKIVPDPANNRFDVLMRKVMYPQGQTSYQISQFDANKTYTNLANTTASRTPSTSPVFTIDSDKNFRVAYAFNNGEANRDDLHVSKVTRTNAWLWASSFTPPNSASHIPAAVTTDAQGNTYVAGMMAMTQTTYGYGIIKYDPNGKQLWVTQFKPEEDLYHYYRSGAYDIAVNSRGEVIVTGGLYSENFTSVSGKTPYPAHTLKLSTDGKILWDAKTDAVTDDVTRGYNVVLDEQENIYILAFTENNKLGSNVALIKYTPGGQQVWKKTFKSNNYYGDWAIGRSDRAVPILKLYNNQLYVGIVSYENRSGYHSTPLDIHRVDLNGNETLSIQSTCSGNNFCTRQIKLLDLIVSPDGTLYTFHSQSGFDDNAYGLKNVITAYAATGEQLWLNTEEADNETYDGALVSDGAGNFYSTTATGENLYFSRRNAEGKIVWNVKTPVGDTEHKRGHPCFVFLNAAGNPVFIGTKKQADNLYYFAEERDQVTGKSLDEQTYDSGHPEVPAYLHINGDRVIAYHHRPSTDEFVIAGVSEERSMGAQTFATIKFSTRSQPLKAQFSSVRKVVRGNAVLYTDASTGTIANWQWTFQGGTPAVFNGQTPPHITYNTPGTFAVGLKITNASSSHEQTIQNYIDVLPKLKADFIVTTPIPQVGQDVILTDASVGPIDQWEWSFQSANIKEATTQSPGPLRYAADGTYRVRLIVRNDVDADTLHQKITVFPIITGVEETLQSVSIYPTVTSDILNIEQPASRVSPLQIIDSFGRKVMLTNTQSTRYNVTSLKPGLYLITNPLNGSIVGKFIKQ